MHFYVSTNYTIIITIVLTLQLLTYVINLYVSINLCSCTKMSIVLMICKINYNIII